MIAGDEEGAPNPGTANIVRYLEARWRTLGYCIVTEPTPLAHLGDTIKNGRRGSAWGHITIRGFQWHPAYPERPKKPIQLSFQALDEIETYDWTRPARSDEATTMLQFTSSSSGALARNVIPGVLQATCNMRHTTRVTEEVMRQIVEDVLPKHWLESSID